MESPPMSRRLTTDEWVAKAKEQFGDRYDYRLVNYKDYETPVQIICRKHNSEFQQRPDTHLRGNVGCRDCQKESPSGLRKYTKADFLRKAQEKHGSKYDYSRVDFKNTHAHVTIVCRKHNRTFEQTPQMHLRGNLGCPACKDEHPLTRRKYTTADFIEKALQKLGSKYDYRLVDYKNSKTPVTIVCRKHDREFQQIPSEHLLGLLKCRDCRYERDRANRKYTKADFVRDAQKNFGSKYDYSLVDYKNAQTHVTIVCREHNEEFDQFPSSHLSGREGCPSCRRDIPGGPLVATEEFIKRARQVHGNAFNYDETDYKGSQEKVRIYCRRHEKFFEVTPRAHVGRKQGCDECRPKNYRQLPDLGIETWIERSKAKHGERFDYSQVNYLNDNEPVQVICRKHAARGMFRVIPHHHLRFEDGGCRYCGPVLNTDMLRARCKEIHPDHYDFSKAYFTNYNNTVTVYCTKHYYTFRHKAVDLLQGQGCKFCGPERSKFTRWRNTETFIARSKMIHGDFYVYDRAEYTGAFEFLEIGCPIHGYFHITAHDHLTGSGCSTCGKVSRAVQIGKAKWQDHPEVAKMKGLLYYLRIVTPDERELFKIGVTTDTVDIRYQGYRGRARPLEIEILAQWPCAFAAAMSVEDHILTEHKADRAQDEQILEGGNTELFTRDVLGLSGPDAKTMKQRISRALRASENKWAEVLGWNEP
jgi:hypothetical protein